MLIVSKVIVGCNLNGGETIGRYRLGKGLLE